MFGTLFLKECKQTGKSVTYFIFILCMVLFFVSQMGDFTGIQKPDKKDEDFGYTYSQDENIVMEGTLNNLVGEYSRNSYTTYPFGFCKNVVLNEEKKKRIEAILVNITGIPQQEFKEKIEEYRGGVSESISPEGYKVIEEENQLILTLRSDLTYEQFLEYMKEVVQIVGRGSAYEKKHMKKNTYVEKTYEQAMEDYDNILYKDKVSRAYARLFCDYMGIVLGILPVFLAVTRGLRDKRTMVEDVIFSKKASAFQIIVSRYVATIVMILLPLLLLSISPMLQSLYSANAAGVSGDVWAFVKGIFCWLLPTVLVVVSVGLFFTELTNGAVGILVQVVWWLGSLFSSVGSLVGNVGWNLIPRFNTIGDYKVYQNVYGELVRNRLLYTGMGVILLFATLIIYAQKRKGAFGVYGKILSNRKNKLEV